jgi:hypothetical protein
VSSTRTLTVSYPDDASPDNIARIERKADALINGMARKLQAVIDELKKPKWVALEV